MKRLNEMLEKNYILLGAWASIATIISLFLGFQLTVINQTNNSNNKNNYVAENNDDSLIIQGKNNISSNNNIRVDGDDNIVNSNLYYNIIDNPSKYSELEILKQAEYLYDSEDYKAVFNLYSLDQVSNSEIALSNLGYMYAKGLGVQQNIDKAIRKYNAAIQQGSYIARKNKIILLFNNVYALDRNGSFDMKYIREILYEVNILNNLHVDDDFSNYFNGELNFLNSLKNINDFFRRYYYWGKPEIILIYTIPRDDFYTKYENLHESQNDVGSYWTCKKVKRNNRVNDLFKEEWIEVSESVK